RAGMLAAGRDRRERERLTDSNGLRVVVRVRRRQPGEGSSGMREHLRQVRLAAGRACTEKNARSERCEAADRRASSEPTSATRHNRVASLPDHGIKIYRGLWGTTISGQPARRSMFARPRHSVSPFHHGSVSKTSALRQDSPAAPPRRYALHAPAAATSRRERPPNTEDRAMLTRTTCRATQILIIGAVVVGYITPIARLVRITI